MYSDEKHPQLGSGVMLTDNANGESVKKYASVVLEEKRRLMKGKVIDN